MSRSDAQSAGAAPHATEPASTANWTVWTVLENSPGHDSQSRGLVGALGEILPIRPVEVVGRERVRGWMRPWVRCWMGSSGRPLSERMLRRIAEVSVPEDATPPDLVIASGGKSIFAARTFAARHGAPLVYIGEQNRFPDAWFDVIVSPVPGDARSNVIRTELIPTTVTPQVVEAAAANVQRPEGRLWAMVIGGRSRSHRFTDADWRDLARGMNDLAARENIRWLVTTSRRTGPAAETILRDELRPDALADAIWWADAPRRELHAFLGLAELAFVTQDSVTMVTEAVAAGRPVVAVRPRDTRLPAASFLPGYFERLERHGRIRRASVGDLGTLTLDPAGFALHERSVLPDLAHRVVERLGWKQTTASA